MLKKFASNIKDINYLKNCVFRFSIQRFSIMKDDPTKKKTQMSDFNKFFLTKNDETQIQKVENNLPAISKNKINHRRI
jgi:hypothetical protein